MVGEIRDNIILSLQKEFTPEQLKMIDFAVAQAMQGYKVEKEETLPVACDAVLPTEVREFLIRKSMKGCADGTIQRYKELLTDFCLWFGKDIKTAKDTDILVYLALCKKRGNSNRTLEGKRRTFSSLFTFLHDSGKIPLNPIRTIEPIKFEANIREPLDDLELEMVRNACISPRDKALFEVLYSTGCRVSEIVNMNYSDIDFRSRTARVIGKGNKQREVVFNAKSLLAIRVYMSTRDDNDPALFVSDRAPHGRLHKEGIERIVKEIGKRSGINRPISPHYLRHTMATDMLQHGAPLTEVQCLLGHTSPNTTQIYAKTNIDQAVQSHHRCII